ncbi:MAG: alpha/beta hydrolase family protein [Pyrinomonadaceae bacterium]
MLGSFIRARERKLAYRDKNRIVRPFEWGASFITEHANGDDPRRFFAQHAPEIIERSEEFYALPAPVTDYRLAGDQLTWTSAVETSSAENNTVHARFFSALLAPKKANGETNEKPRRAVLVLPQWNADEASHVELCRLLNRFGIAALRLTLPFHEARRPPELERADHLISSNIGRTIQSMRQAVLDARAAIAWLIEQRGFERIGIIGTSIGSCAGFLTFAHDERLDVGVFNHVSGYFADVTWHGISTQHVREGFGDEVTLDELREFWRPISPFPYIPRLLNIRPRPMRFIAARHDLTFPAHLTRDVIAEFKRLGLPVDVAWLPCGHYTSGETPWKYLDGWKIMTFMRKHL